MSRSPKHLVCEYLERIPRKLLITHQDIVREMLRGRHGIYALYRDDRLYYVGLAINLKSRLTTHLRDKHRNAWNRFSVYLTVDSSHTRELESLFLRILLPKGNSQKGKFSKARNLLTALKQEIRRRNREEIEVLTGRRKKVSRKVSKRKKSLRKSADTALGPYVSQRVPIRARHKGRMYKATIHADGWVRYGAWLYSTPTTAARTITKRRVNGWRFWEYERAPGQWLPLADLRT